MVTGRRQPALEWGSGCIHVRCWLHRTLAWRWVWKGVAVRVRMGQRNQGSACI
jgi:hypothetical protein